MKFYQANGSVSEDSPRKFSALDPPCLSAGTAPRILVEVPLIGNRALPTAQRDPGQFLSALTPFLMRKEKTNNPDPDLQHKDKMKLLNREKKISLKIEPFFCSFPFFPLYTYYSMPKGSF